MPTLSMKKAKAGGVLTDKEIERFACLYLICQDRIKPTSDEWQKAAENLGGTAGSFKFAIYSALKKLRDKDCFMPTDENRYDLIIEKRSERDKKRGAKEDGEDAEDGKAAKKGRTTKKGVIKEEPENDSDNA